MQDQALFLLTLSVSLFVVSSFDNTLTEFPLNDQDIIIAQGSSHSVSVPSPQENLSCLIMPVRDRQEETCTWRKSRDCIRVPSLVRSAVYSKSCHEEEPGLYLSHCKEESVPQPLVHTVQVCNIVADMDCMGPCFDCPKICQPTEQGVCENSHSIRTEITIIREIEENTLVRVEKDVVTSNRKCIKKKVEDLCANINCKFINQREECTQRNSSTVVTLRQRKCRICSPSQAERVEVEENCQPNETRDCETDPLERPWRKLCSVSTSEHNSVESESFREERELVTQLNLQELLSSSSSSSVNDLVFQTLSKINIDDLGQYRNPVVVIRNDGDERRKEEGKGLVERELVKSLQNQANQPININMNVKYEFSPRSSTITSSSPSSPVKTSSPTTTTATTYTITTTTTIPTTITPDEIIYPASSLTTRPNSVYFDQSLLTQLQDLSTASVPFTLNSRSVTSTKTTITTTTTATTTSSTTTTTTTITTTTTTTPTTTYRKLSAAELLKMCFDSGIGCDFSQNEVPHEEQTEVTTTTTTTPRPVISSSVEARLKNRVMLCFFQGICSDESREEATEQSEQKVTSPPTRRTTPKPQSRSEQISSDIKARARACFFRGEC